MVKEKYTPVEIVLDGFALKGNLSIPENAVGMVIFSHGSGSSRLSPRNNFVAKFLNENGLGTLLFDLLTEEEDRNYENRFNIDLITMRLIDVTQWVQNQKASKEMVIGYFGASTGAASALRAASFFGEDVKAVVSRGGRPDLAMQELKGVIAPTLLIVGGWDQQVIQLNKKAYQELKCYRQLEIVPEASHLFEEPGKLEQVSDLAARWFKKWLQKDK